MAELIRMPRMSDTMEEGVIVEWLKEVGDKVEPGDVLAEVETDKATMELESYQEGVLLHIGVKEGPVPVDGVLAVIGEEGEDYEELLEEAKKEQEEKQKKETEGKTEEKEEQKEDPSGKQAEAASPEPSEEESKPTLSRGDGRIKASPLARTMAEEEGIELSRIEGSGDGGRIVKRDIEQYLEERAKAPEPGMMPVVGEESTEEIPVSQMRKTIAKRLSESKFSAPHFYLTIDLDMHSAIEARKRINEMIEPDNKISYNDLIIKCCAMALRKHPDINVSWKGDVIERHHHIHIGVAVAVEEGLMVPVLRHADQKNLTRINTEVKSFAEKARNRKLQPEEMQGNTFTISNLGMFGIEEFTGIINPPDSCILAVGSIRETPVVENGTLTVGYRMKVTMSCDHRIVDGATGAKFLQTFREMMEDPIRMIA